MTEFDLLKYIGEADDSYIMDSRRRPKNRNLGGPMGWQPACCWLCWRGLELRSSIRGTPLLRSKALHPRKPCSRKAQ